MVIVCLSALAGCGGGHGGSTSSAGYSIVAAVNGLAGSGLVLRNNGGDDLAVAGNGAFRFATNLTTGTAYAVTVKSQPTAPTQVCTVTNGSGAVASAGVTNIVVDCVTSSFTVGGMVTGLTGSGLALENNGGDDLAIDGDGAFTFSTAVASGQPYAVTVVSATDGPDKRPARCSAAAARWAAPT